MHGPETWTEKITEDGILTNHGNVTLTDYVNLYGEPVHVGPDRVIFRDEDGYEISEWADALGVNRDDLLGRMHKLALEVYEHNEVDGDGDPWSWADPIVFDANTFREDKFEALALLVRRGCSPAEALDWFATESQSWTQTAWSKWRKRSQQNVSGNVSGARQALDE